MAEHVRIDEGLKRPKHKHKLPAVKREGQSATIPDGLDPDKVLDLYLSESTTSTIALRLGVRRHSLTRWLRTVRPEAWKRAQAIRALCRVEDGQDGIAVACDALSLARARELLRAGQWELERLDADYAPQQNVTIAVSLDLGDRLRRARDRVDSQVIDCLNESDQENAPGDPSV